LKQLRERLIRYWSFILAALATFAGFSIAPIVVATHHEIGWLSYPLYFGSYMLLNGLVFTVLLPYRVKRAAALPVLQRWLRVDEKRFQSGVWPWLKSRGAFVTTLGASLLLSPFFAAVYIRFLGLPEKKAWVYAFTSTLVTTVVMVAIYSGVFHAIKAWLF
jgi:hypothetical protein